MKRIVVKSTMYITLLALLMVWSSCEKEAPVPPVEITVEVEMPALAKGATVEGLKVKATNKGTGTTSEATAETGNAIAITLEEGIYNFEVSGQTTYTYTDIEGVEQTKTEALVGLVENISVSSAMASPVVSITAHVSSNSTGWVIKEIYSAGTKTSVGAANYNKVQFVEIYNNSSETLYADGLAIGETAITSGTSPNYYADDLNDSTYVQTLYSIPGNGTEHPVKPGESVLLAPYPFDHTKEFDPADNNLLDLSGADWQWYDEHRLVVDVPEVPNMVRHYSYSASIWIVAVQMNRGFVLFKTSNINNYVESNTDIRKNNAGKTATAIRLSNSEVLDAVDLGSPETIKAKTISSSLDLGFTYCSSTYNGKSVRRKVSHVEADGRVVYQDTNNSTVDFIPNAEPQPRQFNTN